MEISHSGYTASHGVVVPLPSSGDRYGAEPANTAPYRFFCTTLCFLIRSTERCRRTLLIGRRCERNAMNWSFKLFTIRGIDVRVHVTFVLILLWASYYWSSVVDDGVSGIRC